MIWLVRERWKVKSYMSCIVCTDKEITTNLHGLLEVHRYHCKENIEKGWVKTQTSKPNPLTSLKAYKDACGNRVTQINTKIGKLSTFLHARGDMLWCKLLFLTSSLDHHTSVILQHQRRQSLGWVRHVNRPWVSANFSEVRQRPNMIQMTTTKRNQKSGRPNNQHPTKNRPSRSRLKLYNRNNKKQVGLITSEWWRCNRGRRWSPRKAKYGGNQGNDGGQGNPCASRNRTWFSSRWSSRRRSSSRPLAPHLAPDTRLPLCEGSTRMTTSYRQRTRTTLLAPCRRRER